MGVVREEGARGPWTTQVRPTPLAAHLPRAPTQPARGARQHLQGHATTEGSHAQPTPNRGQKELPGFIQHSICTQRQGVLGSPYRVHP